MKDLCAKCKHCTAMSGGGREIKYCSAVMRPVTFPVWRCNEYEERGTMNLHQMQRMAYYIKDKPDSPCGFVFERTKISYLTEETEEFVKGS